VFLSYEKKSVGGKNAASSERKARGGRGRCSGRREREEEENKT